MKRSWFEKGKIQKEKLQNRKFQNKEQGISMVALVVTIIVLLILASIGIRALTGENGILSSSINAKKDAEQTSKEIEENEKDFIKDLNEGNQGSSSSKNIITITFDPNEGEGGPQKQSVSTEGEAGVNIKISDKKPTRENYTFLGWSKEKDSEEVNYESGKTYKFETSTTIYAVWTETSKYLTVNPNGGIWRGEKENTIIKGKIWEEIEIENPTPPEGYKVTFNGNGGSTPEAKKSTKSFTEWTKEGGGELQGNKYTFGIEYGKITANYKNNSIILPETTRTGYTFKGWYTEKAGGEKIGNAGQTYTPERDVTIYAQWTANTYTIVFNGNTQTGGSTASMSMTYDVEKNLTPNGFTKTGYTFTGWNTKADGTGTGYADKAVVKNLASEQGATVT